jgi:hypothetical protein
MTSSSDEGGDSIEQTTTGTVSIVSLDSGGMPGVTLDSAAGDTVRRRRTPFVSRHRRSLEHIQTDAQENRLHPVGRSRLSSPQHEYAYGCWSKMKANITETFENKTTAQWVETFLPCWAWMKGYACKETLSKDVIAGLTVGIMIVPQSMSYAKLAGLPVEFGLYSALIPVYACALLHLPRVWPCS